MATSPLYDCNVVLVGKSGCGKSTVANHIMSANVFPVRDNHNGAEDVPKKTQHSHKTQHSTCTLNCEGISHQLLIIDTAGLSDCDIKQANIKSIMDDTKKCIETNAFQGLNLVLFVTKLECFNEEEAKIMDFIIDNLQDKAASEHSALIITNCENKSKNDREEVVKQFRESDETKKYATFMKKGIYTVGFSKEEVSVSVKQDKEMLRDLVANASSYFTRKETRDENLQIAKYGNNCEATYRNNHETLIRRRRKCTIV